ncbi:unnamed protein product [Phyllotreta striolata]|uniref:Major facilitator superfamily (MFS) profile domain-containing protein n=1 Tax=Phyllotreta striolata TaxID=444603 RepID=A0A9N9TIF6_PHYSR|nr:unnamed protein product [Phyllotreta striolata]
MILKYVFFNQFAGALCAVCLVGLLAGVAISWSSPVIPKLQHPTDDNPFDQPITAAQSSWMTSLMTLGSCTGCCLFGYLAHFLGRRPAMCALNAPMALGYALMALHPTIEVFYVARFLAGLSLGGGQITTLAYNSEISSKTNRGALMTFSAMMVSVGSLLGYCIGPWLSVTTFNLIIAVITIAATLQAVLFCIETPYFYLMKGEEHLAKQSLIAYRGAGVNVDKEIEEIKENIKEQREGNLSDVIKTKAFVRSFVTATVLLTFQQLTGINGVLMFSQSIFESTGSNFSPAVCSIVLGALQVASGAIGPLVAERFRRRLLLAVSALGMAAAEAVLGVFCVLNDLGNVAPAMNFVPVASLCFFVFSYNFGVGPLCWIVGAEVFSTRVKTWAFSISIITYHGIGFFIAQYFNAVASAIGIGELFFIFAGFCALCILFIRFYLIETKGKSLEEIQCMLKT